MLVDILCRSHAFWNFPPSSRHRCSKTATSEPTEVTVFDRDVGPNHLRPGLSVPQPLPRLTFWQIEKFLGNLRRETSRLL